MTAVETLRIKNFAGIKDAQIELSRMNVFIGPQASGKSVCAKLLFYFREIIRRMTAGVASQRTDAQIHMEDEQRFFRYFPPISWGAGDFVVEYAVGDFSVKVVRAESASATVKVTYSALYAKLLSDVRQVKTQIEEERSKAPISHFLDPLTTNTLYSVIKGLSEKIDARLGNYTYFIPAGRSFFAALQNNIFSLMADNINIDPFLTEFGRLFEGMSYNYHYDIKEWLDEKLVKRVSQLICGTYLRVEGEDYILAADGRQVPFGSTSSGQQEVLPLVITLVGLAPQDNKAMQATLFIEEPEAHLYPTAQREIVHLLAAVTDLASDETSSQYVITTHSPYILSALNNLMYGAQLAAQSPDKRARVVQVLGDAALVPAENVRAYAFGDGQVQSIIDAETGLVRATILDSVSNELAKEFGDLLDIEFEDEEMAA